MFIHFYTYDVLIYILNHNKNSLTIMHVNGLYTWMVHLLYMIKNKLCI